MRIKQLKELVDNYLSNYFKDKGSYNSLIYDAASYSLNVGGKRIRPILFMLVYFMYKGEDKEVIDMAAAIEMIHTYSLIHDDLPCMDNDDLRRGKPTNHKVYGENIAVLAGDALLNEAMILLMDFSIKHGKDALVAAREIAYAAGADGMIGGQVVDIINEGKRISKEELNYMHLKKTGELIRSSIVAGAILAEADKSEIDLLNKFGMNLGLAFQIKDDILDVTGDVEKLGKNTLADVNKSNFITMYGLEECKVMCEDLTAECITILDKISVNTDILKELTIELLKRDF
ncbi:MAG: polyprenyl synthetase family protein [Clostridium sp.]|uniref:polyprenyl synthetase family protein n=1 Tax=Clostridium sp. TaxID=1506 RepID=UPI0026741442|nr:farnesyl diphosphate synthase [Clostridium sp.]MDD7682951.1 polyprenyl synthetase family protein [Clostridium sp.]MDY2579893.1 farnesyl diphosphate synthase [Clostridium sp.]